MAKDWSAQQYVKFEDERTRPVRDLLAHVPNTDVKTAIDLGCGPGNSTEELLRRFPGATVSGLDSSPDMIAAARKRLPELSFDIADLNHWSGEARYDVILSNAVLQWLPHHDRLLPQFLQRLNAGGAMALQIPANLNTPVQLLMREVAAAKGPWQSKLADVQEARYDRYDAAWYYRLLHDKTSRLDLWVTDYHHILASPAAIVEWFKSTGLRPFLDPLDEAEKTAYLEAFGEEVAKAYPPMPDGKVIMIMPRLFIVATV